MFAMLRINWNKFRACFLQLLLDCVFSANLHSCNNVGVGASFIELFAEQMSLSLLWNLVLLLH